MSRQELLDGFADNAQAWSELVAKHLVGQVDEKELNDRANQIEDARKTLMEAAKTAPPPESK